MGKRKFFAYDTDRTGNMDEVRTLVEVDWDDLTNQPFYEEGFRYTFDGDIDAHIAAGKEYIATDTTAFVVKLSDDAPERNDIMGATVTINIGGQIQSDVVGATEYLEPYDLSANCGAPEGTIWMVGGEGPIIIVYDDVITPSGGFFKGATFTKGVWSMCSNNGEFTMYITEFSKVGVKQIEKKYIPKWDAVIDFGDNPKLNSSNTVGTMVSGNYAELLDMVINGDIPDVCIRYKTTNTNDVETDVRYFNHRITGAYNFNRTDLSDGSVTNTLYIEAYVDLDHCSFIIHEDGVVTQHIVG